MKSYVKQRYVEDTTKNVLDNSMIVIDNNDGSKSVTMKEFAKYLIDMQLNDNLSYKNWRIEENKEWSCTFITAGGRSFNVKGLNVTDCIRKANSIFENGEIK